MPLAGLGEGAKGVAATALREVADTYKVQLTYGEDKQPWPSRLSIQGLQLRILKSTPPTSVNEIESALAANPVNTKLVDVTPSGSGDKIAYSFGLYTPENKVGQTLLTTGLGQVVTNPFEHKIFSLEDNDDYTSVKRIESIATQFGEGWDYSILKAASVPSVKDGAKDSTLYAELWTDVASAGENDYMVGGWWLLAPNDLTGDYRFGAIAKGEKYYPRSGTGGVKPGVEGPATYKGNAAGLHISSEDGTHRLLGKVTLTADFGTTAANSRGTIGGRIDNLTLGDESVTGEILLPTATLGTAWSLRPVNATNDSLNPKSNVGNIKGINYMGDWAGTFLGDSSGTDQPTGIVGVVGGSGGGNSFVASFGAKKVEDE